MNVYITKKYSDEKHAGSKAPSDINTLCQELGWNEVTMPFPAEKQKRLIRMLKRVLWALQLSGPWDKVQKLKPKCIFVQYPVYVVGNGITARFERRVMPKMLSRIKKANDTKIIVLVHDLESLRRGASDQEIRYIDMADYIICHNKKMKECLMEKGIREDKLIILEIFDYLCEEGKQSGSDFPQKKSVAIAGNLMPEKSGYIYKFMESNQGLQVHLYGVNYQGKADDSNVVYHGSFTPEELPQKMEAAFGIVWDGPEITTCCGNWGAYLRWNNPHKLSLYLAAGMPVITWKQAAIAEFVKKYGVGITVDSLENLSDAIERVSDEEYQQMRANAQAIGTKLREGWYFKRALQEAMNRAQNQK